jgi:curved DNA-binding protein CbpA
MKIFKLNKKQFYNFTRRTYIFTRHEAKLNYYELLGVDVDSDYETIKKSYYKLAKENHPDLNPDPKALEKFKKVSKAYEVLGDPNLRIAYDIENDLQTNDNARRESDERFTSRYGKRVMSGPRTIKNFYYNKWTEYKTPQWSNLKDGMDSQTEYILREKEDDLEDSATKYRIVRNIKRYRLFIYFLIIFSPDLLFVYNNWNLFSIYRMIRDAFFI